MAGYIYPVQLENANRLHCLQSKNAKYLWFQILKCEDLLCFCVLSHCEFNIFGFWAACQKKTQAILRCLPELQELAVGILHYFQTQHRLED